MDTHDSQGVKRYPFEWKLLWEAETKFTLEEYPRTFLDFSSPMRGEFSRIETLPECPLFVCARRNNRARNALLITLTLLLVTFPFRKAEQ